jgi:hypothetical protein
MVSAYLLIKELQVGCAVVLGLAGGLFFVLRPVPVCFFIIPLIVALVVSVGSAVELEIVLQRLLAVLKRVSWARPGKYHGCYSLAIASGRVSKRILMPCQVVRVHS